MHVVKARRKLPSMNKYPLFANQCWLWLDPVQENPAAEFFYFDLRPGQQPQSFSDRLRYYDSSGLVHCCFHGN